MGEPVAVVSEADEAARIEEAVVPVEDRVRFEGEDDAAEQRVKDDDADEEESCLLYTSDAADDLLTV